MLDHLITAHGSYRSTDAPRLAVVLRETLAGLFARTLQDEEQYVPTAAYRRDLLLRMRMFIDQHLSDPELGPRLIAAAHNVSISYVHRLFGDDGTTVAGWVMLLQLWTGARPMGDAATPDARLRRAFPRILAACAVMGLALLLAARLLAGTLADGVSRYGALGLLVAIGISVYAAAVVAFGGIRFADLRAALRRGA